MSLSTISTANTGSVVTLDGFMREKFVINRILHGGMGLVYLLTPMRDGGSLCALKTFQAEAGSNEFKRECQLWLSISGHPGIARAYWYGYFLGQPGILVDWYPNCLANCDTRQWSDNHLEQFILGLLEALEYTQSKGIVHQDIKPANILIDDAGLPKLTDFGIARFSGEKTSIGRIGDMTNGSGTVVTSDFLAGTPLYMAPELLLGRSKPSLATDIYSLGITLFEMVAGQHPYIGHESGGRFNPQPRMHLLAEVIKQRGEFGKRLYELISAAIAFEPSARTPSYCAMLRHLTPRSSTVDSGNEEVEVGLNQVRLWRTEGRIPEAGAILDRLIKRYPDDPEVLNSIALLFVSKGDIGAAEKVTRRAVGSLVSTQGLAAGGTKFFIAPLMNLADALILRRNPKCAQEAHALLQKAWHWAADHKGVTDYYAEFGWMFSYDALYKAAVDHLAKCLASKAPDDRTILWLTHASWRAGIFAQMSSDLSNKILHTRMPGVFAGFCAALVAAWVNISWREPLLAFADGVAGDQLKDFEERLQIPPRSCRPPIFPSVSDAMVTSMEAEMFGEVRHGIV